MSENDDQSRWPDLKLASTLWSLLGSQPSTDQEKATLEGAEAIAQLRSNGAPPLQDNREGESSVANASHRDQGLPSAASVMSEPQGTPIHGLDDLNDYVQDREHGDGAEADFGALEMFDSNALQAPFSSSLAATADDANHASSRKSKRDKKKKKSSQVQEGERSVRRSVRPEGQTDTAAQEAGEEYAGEGEAAEAETSTKSKKKRKHLDSDDHKRPKRRRSHHEDDGQHDAEGPSATGENMDVDEANLNGQTEQAEDPAMSTREVTALAREALNEQQHRAGADGMTGEQGGAETYPEASDQRRVYGSPIPSQPADPPSSSKKKNSKGKKAKPTYFEDPPELEVDEDHDEDNLDALGNLPSPSALTPKPRNRTKKSARSSKSRKAKLSQSMRGGSEDHDEARAGGKSSRSMRGFTQGRFTDVEMGRIVGVLEHFKKEHDLDQNQINEMIQAPGGTTAGELHAEMWTRIFDECQDRHRQKVINTCRKKFHNFVARGTWTLEQDAELTALIDVHGQKWSKIGGIINRHPEDIRDRYRNYLVCGANQRKDTWDEHEEQRLMQYVIEAMEAIDELRRIQPSRELLKKPYEELIDWQNISERMDRTRSRLQCITKWKAMNLKTNGADQLVSQNPETGISFRLEKARRQIKLMPDDEKFRLVLAIEATGVGTDAKIPWQRLVDKQFRNSWHRTTQVLLWRRLRSTVPGQESKTVRDIAKQLLDQYNSTGQFSPLEDEHFDVHDENRFMSILPASGAPNSTKSRGGRGSQPISQQFIMEADDGDNAAENAARAVAAAAAAQPILQGDSGMAAPEAAMTSDIQIDPALAAATQQLVLPNVEHRPSSSTKKAKKGGSSRKKVKRTTPEMMEAVAALAGQHELPAGTAQDGGEYVQLPSDSEAVEGNASGKLAADEAAGSESDIDDMEDLPARVPTQVDEV